MEKKEISGMEVTIYNSEQEFNEDNGTFMLVEQEEVQ